MKPEVILFHSNYERSTFQIHAGFKILHDIGIIKLIVKKTNESIYKRKDLPITKIEINGLSVIYDTLDGYRFDHNYSVSENLELLDQALERCDFYFKRSYSIPFIQSLKNKNIYPLGLNYPVYNLLLKDYLEYKFLSKEYMKSILKYNRFLAKILNLDYYKDTFPQNLSNKPLELFSYKYSGSILFLARVWDPYEEPLPDDLIKERFQINERRANCIRECKKMFGNLFCGGLNDTEFTRKNYKDLIVPRSITGKGNYLKVMKKASICIATSGLHNSIGWKFGEYVACSKAIISEELNYYVDDNFKEGQNYLSFNQISSVPEIISNLLDNPDKIRNMMRNNFQYYKNYLKPEQLVLNTLKKSKVI